MDSRIHKILGYFDLSEGEIETYLALLRLGRGTAYEIAKATELKRPTVYVFIQKLIRKGLVTTRYITAKTICYPVAPDRLFDIWKGRLEALEGIRPELNSLYRAGDIQPKVQVFEGQTGVDAVYNELPPLEAAGEEILLFGSIRAITEGFAYLFPRWEQSFRNKKNPIRELLCDEPGIDDYLTKRKAFPSPNYQMRMMAGDVFGKTDNIIWQNKLAIFSLKKELFVTLIESVEIVTTYRALFDAAWTRARVIK